ncbi:MAG: hypothetical protein WBD09_11760 [Halobacteriota archaeon]
MVLHVDDRKKLWGLAAAKCSKCQCNLFLEEEGNTNIGEESHISSHSPDFPSKGFSRYIPSPSLSDVERDNKYDNAILLCGLHHKVIDNPRNTQYTIEKLHQIKAEHEAWVAKKLSEDTEESGELKRRIGEVTRKIEIYKLEFTLNKKRFEWTKNALDNKIKEIGEKNEVVDLEGEFRPILTSSTTKYLGESLEEHGGATDRPVSCPFCCANLVYDPDSDAMYCRSCKKFIEEI